MDYLREVMTKSYEYATDEGYQWPTHFSKATKVQLIESFISYWQDEEDYEKCMTLQRTLEKIKSE